MQPFTVCSWRARKLLDRIWYGGHPLKWLLWPLSWLFALLSAARRAGYRSGLLKSTELPVPVIVVGNISVGGTGKTPFTMWLVEHLKEQGWQPGIVSRGYGGESATYPLSVTAASDPAQAGDEPVLLATRTGCPLVVDPKRVRAAQSLVAEHGVNIIISDDGLQHYALQRDVEIVIVDAERRCGNGMLLPAGPLREARGRLQQVDAVIVNGADQEETGFNLVLGQLFSLTQDQRKGLAAFSQSTVHALAGIGNPERFFVSLEQAGLSVIRHVFADHHDYSAADISFGDDYPVLMTEKDAVKCRAYADDRHWCLPVTAEPNALAMQHIQRCLAKLGNPPMHPASIE